MIHAEELERGMFRDKFTKGLIFEPKFELCEKVVMKKMLLKSISGLDMQTLSF